MIAPPSIPAVTPSVSVEALAAHWGVHHITVRRMIRDGKLSAFRVGRLLRVAIDEVRSYEERAANGSAA